MHWLKTLRGQFVAVVALAVILSSLAVIAILETARQGEIRRVRIAALTERVANAFEVVAELGRGQRDGAVRAMNTDRFRYWIADEDPFPARVMNEAETRMATAVKAAQENQNLGVIRVRLPADADIRMRAPADGRNRRVDDPRLRMRGDDDIEITQTLDSGRHLLVQFDPPGDPPQAPDMLIAAALAAVLTSAAAAWLGGRVSRPLSELAQAAGEVARGNTNVRLEPHGPEEFRRAAEAFNTMSERVARTLESHHQLLSAVGHDLRTPLAAMRITTEFVTDREVRSRLTRNIEELQSLTEAVLSAARAGPSEEMHRVDLAALIESVCDDLIELGQPVTVEVEGPAPCLIRSNEIRRAVRNLVENAVRYGFSASVKLVTEPDYYVALIEDDGPGIPEDKLEAVFQPFVRLEHSRSNITGGVGLGLTLSRTIVREHGGDVTLENRSEGGLRARLRLPREKAGQA
jgi:signal transduction histidine kinase